MGNGRKQVLIEFLRHTISYHCSTPDSTFSCKLGHNSSCKPRTLYTLGRMQCHTFHSHHIHLDWYSVALAATGQEAAVLVHLVLEELAVLVDAVGVQLLPQEYTLVPGHHWGERPGWGQRR